MEESPKPAAAVCHRCLEPVPENAARCPKCGEPLRKSVNLRVALGVFGLLVFLGMVALAFILMHNSGARPGPGGASRAPSHTHREEPKPALGQ